jgi:S1-C subfamily serine protease
MLVPVGVACLLSSQPLGGQASPSGTAPDALHLSILGIELTIDLARSLPALRIPSGVIVAARTLGSRINDVPLQTGDVIHTVNGTFVSTLQELRAAVATPKPGDLIVLQIERFGQLEWVAFTS